MAHGVAAPAVERGAEVGRAVSESLLERRLRRVAAQQGAEEVFVGDGHAQARELLHREAADWRDEHGRQRDLLPRVVNGLQQGEHEPHLIGLEIAAIDVGIGRDAVLAQQFEQGVRLALDGAQQHGDIAVRERTIAARILVEDAAARLHETCDAVRDVLGLELEALKLLAARLISRICRLTESLYGLLRLAAQDDVKLHGPLERMLGLGI